LRQSAITPTRDILGKLRKNNSTANLRGNAMKQLVNEEAKRVDFYLTNADQQDEQLMADVRAQCRQWHQAGYRAVMFLSGKGDLEECIGDLLRHNLRVMAKREGEISMTTPKARSAGAR